MARGYPDFAGSVGTNQEGQFLQTLARPPVWFHDNFDSPTIKWTADVGSIRIRTDSLGGLLPGMFMSGSGILFMTADPNHNAQVSKQITGNRLNSRVGIAVNFWLYPLISYGNLWNSILPIHFTIYDVDKYYTMMIGYNSTTGKWYWSGDGGATSIEVCEVLHTADGVNFVKLIFDPVTRTPVSLQVNSESYSLSSYTITQYDKTNTRLYASALFYFHGNAANYGYVAIDDYLVTYGET